MKVVVCCVAVGGWYPRGAARLIEHFHATNPGIEIQAHVNVLPFGAPANVIEDGYDYTAYCAKAFALAHARNTGADVAILLDCAFWPIRSIHSLIDHIAQRGYYFCKNGNLVGEWSSDRCLVRMGVLRNDALQMEEISSYCVGLNFADGRCVELLQRWCGFAGDRLTVPGPHTNKWIRSSNLGHFNTQIDSVHNSGRNPGFASEDDRVRGHRHDQTVLSILAHKMGMRELTERPRFTAYAGSENETTVLINQGMGS